MKSIIDVKNLSFRYKESQEYYDVKDITFHVKRGEWLSIVGHNGSGKSTTVRLIDGLLEAESGEIVIDGQRLTEENVWNIRRQIGMVFKIQTINLLERLLKMMLPLVWKIRDFLVKK